MPVQYGLIVIHRIFCLAVEPYFKVQMRTGRGAGIADLGYRLPFGYHLTGGNKHLAAMGVTGGITVAVGNFEIQPVASAALILYIRDGAGFCRDDGASVHAAAGNINARVQSAPPVAESLA